MEVVSRIPAVRQAVQRARREDLRVGFVPTMGYLHEGHLALMRQARQECDLVVVSIFVNPTQFGPNEDFERYPRDLLRDTALCQQAPVDLIFTPDVAEIYPRPLLSWVRMSSITDTLCGASRPGHFDGVATIVTKLLNIVQPDVAYFGQKDAQQVAVIQRMVADLNMDWTEIRVVPTVREPDGLAMSSRNVYLSLEERQAAVVLFRALRVAEERVAAGERDMATLAEQMRIMIAAEPLAEIDYIQIVDLEKLSPTERLQSKALAALAVRFGKTRLIDNTILSAPYHIRPVSVKDLQPTLAMLQEAQITEYGEPEQGAEDLADEWHRLHLETDTWLVTLPDGHPVAYATLDEMSPGRLVADGTVHPAHVGRGLGALLLRLTEGRARCMAVEKGWDTPVLYNHVNGHNPAACHLMKAQGYTPVKSFWRMSIEMESPPPEPTWPEGITVRTFVPGQDERATFEAYDESFSSLPGHPAGLYERFAERFTSLLFDPSLWFLAEAEGEIVGISLCNSFEGMGWVRNLGVRDAWRKQGLGLALLQHSFVQFYRRGYRRVALGVDSTNPTGATRLYERAGMRQIRLHIRYEKRP